MVLEEETTSARVVSKKTKKQEQQNAALSAHSRLVHALLSGTVSVTVVFFCSNRHSVCVCLNAFDILPSDMFPACRKPIPMAERRRADVAHMHTAERIQERIVMRDAIRNKDGQKQRLLQNDIYSQKDRIGLESSSWCVYVKDFQSDCAFILIILSM